MGSGAIDGGDQRPSAGGVGRRGVLHGLIAGVAVVLSRRRTAAARTRPSDAERRLAALGARLAREAPETAARLADEVAREVCGNRPTRLLRPDRIARDLAAGTVVSVDGWMLARSEAAVAAYLHRARRLGAR